MDAEILLVEDNEADARLVELLLEDAREGGFVIDRVSKLEEAGGRIRDHEYDAVVLDLGLPDSTGTTTVARLREATRDAAIVVLSGLADERVVSDAFSRGAQAFVHKGRIDGENLAEAIDQSIARHRFSRIAEHLVQEATEKLDDLRAVFDALPEGLVLHEDGVVLQANKASQRILGVTGHGILCDPLIKMDEDEPQSVEVMVDGDVCRYEVRQREISWRGRMVTMMMLSRSDDRQEPARAVQTGSEPLESVLSGSLDAMTWRHQRLADFVSVITGAVQSGASRETLLEILEEAAPENLVKELRCLDSGTRSAFERFLAHCHR